MPRRSELARWIAPTLIAVLLLAIAIVVADRDRGERAFHCVVPTWLCR